MPNYEIDMTYKVEEGTVVNLSANDVDQAEEFAIEHVKEFGEDISDIQVVSVRELP